MAFLKLLFIRHGQSYGNAAGRMEGWSSTGLTPLGKQQALRLGRRLATEGWRPTHVYCSPLQRATETLAGVLTGFHNTPFDDTQLDATGPPLIAPVCFRDDLKEYNNGVLAGLTWAEAQERYPELCQALEQCLDWLPIPAAETLQAGQHRSQQFVTSLLSQHRNGDRVWVISHHWILQQIMARLMACDRTWGFAIDHTALFEFWIDHSRWHQTGDNRFNTELWQLKRFNDCEHCAS